MIKKIKDIVLIVLIVFSFVSIYLYINKVKDYGAIEEKYNDSENKNADLQIDLDLKAKEKIDLVIKYDKKFKSLKDKKPEKVIITKWKTPEKIIIEKKVYVKMPEEDYEKIKLNYKDLQISFNIKVDKIKWLIKSNKELKELLNISNSKYKSLFETTKISKKFIKVLKKQDDRFILTFGGFVNPSGNFSVGLGFGVKIYGF